MGASEFDVFCRHVFQFIENNDVSCLVIGGLAVIAVGEPRATADVDIIAFISMEKAKDIISRSQEAGFDVTPAFELKRLQETGTLSLKKGKFRLDIILASLPFEKEALKRASQKKLFGKVLKFPAPEDLIIFKIAAGRKKDLLDAEGIIRRHKGKLDINLIETTLQSLCDMAADMSYLTCFENMLKSVDD